MLINHVIKGTFFFTVCFSTGSNLWLPVCFRVLQVQKDRSASRGSEVLLGSGERTALTDVKEREDFRAPRAAPEIRVTPGRTARR